MHNTTINTRNRGSWKVRAITTCSALVAVLVLPATTAHAEHEWNYSGPMRYNSAEADRDLPGLKAQCRKDWGAVMNSGLFPSGIPASSPHYAFVACHDIRPTP